MCCQIFQWVISNCYIVGLQKFSVMESGEGDNVVQIFCVVEMRLGEWQIGRDIQYNGVVDFGCQLVKFMY